MLQHQLPPTEDVIVYEEEDGIMREYKIADCGVWDEYADFEESDFLYLKARDHEHMRDLYIQDIVERGYTVHDGEELYIEFTVDGGPIQKAIVVAKVNITAEFYPEDVS